jgi:hypothetical protein
VGFHPLPCLARPIAQFGDARAGGFERRVAFDVGTAFLPRCTLSEQSLIQAREIVILPARQVGEIGFN